VHRQTLNPRAVLDTNKSLEQMLKIELEKVWDWILYVEWEENKEEAKDHCTSEGEGALSESQILILDMHAST
jgi:hypothetical protein